MRTFDGALFELYKQGKISLEEAVKNADSANNLRLRVKLDQEGGAGGDSGTTFEISAIEEDEESGML